MIWRYKGRNEAQFRAALKILDFYQVS